MRTERSVEPTRSQKRTVSCRRSPAGNVASGDGAGVDADDAAVSRVAPQPPQKFSPGSFVAPHAAHGTASAAPHFPQNRLSARFSWLQAGQRIALRGQARRQPLEADELARHAELLRLGAAGG